MNFELTEAMAIIGAIFLFYFGRLFIEMEIENIAARYICRIIGVNMMLMGGYYWLGPVTETPISTLIVLSIIVTVMLGWLFIKMKAFGDRCGLLATLFIMIGVLFSINIVHMCVILSVIMVCATIYETMKQSKSGEKDKTK